MDMDALIPMVQEKINGLIPKPKMSEKLLNKPPFRFLHDTISAVINTTGFANGLYSDEDMDVGTISDKGAKIAYLEKIFTVVGICHVSVKIFSIQRLTR
jgi:TRAF3-interacting protein 1